jgi:thiamine pyrophosphate-dependent acetolactate synthase large subunit-like protein
VLAVPVDLQEAPYTGLQSVLAAVPAESECPALPAAPELEKLTEAVLHSRFPLIVAGKGAIDARLELMALGETIGALVGTTLPTKGLFGGETYDAGIIGGLSSTETEKLIEQTDLVIAFGASMNHFTRGEGRYFKNCKLICIDRDATREVPLNGTLVHGDAKATAVALHDELKSRGHSNIGHRKPEIANRLESAGVIQPGAASDDGLDPRKLFRRIAAALPRDVQVSTGLGHFWSFSTLYLPHKWPARSYFSVGFGAIGSALPLGIGVRMARQTERCVVIEGDGSLLQHLQELETAAKLGLPITVIVANDSGYGAEVHKLKQKGHNSALAQWSSIDFAGVARACGGEGVTVVSDDEIDNALKAAERADGLFLIDCRISPTTTSDVYNRKILGMAVEVPLLRAG